MAPGDRFRGLLEWPDGIRRLSVLVCAGITIVALGLQYPSSLRATVNRAQHNASMSAADREFSTANGVIADQQALYEARIKIPADESYAFEIGAPVEGWTDLTVPFASQFALTFLLPRRQDPAASWVLCYACDRGDAVVVWEGFDGISILRRAP